MRIIFFGYRGSFAYRQIGGTDSFFRRLGMELAKRNHQIYFVHYGYLKERSYSTVTGITVHELCGFGDSLRLLGRLGGSIIVNAIRAKDRVGFIAFRHRLRNQLRFHMVYSLFSESRLNRFKHFLEAAIYPYNGGCICMSGRLVRHVHEYHNKADLLLPPVDREYYRSPEEKSDRGKFIVAYIGRLEYGKGAAEAIEILEELSSDTSIDARVMAYYFEDTPEAVGLRERLISNDNIEYHETTHGSWTHDIEERIVNELCNIDVLLLPYRKVCSSIDTPLLLLEGMASLCCCVIRSNQHIAQIYGRSRFVIDGNGNFVGRTCDMIRELDRSMIAAERARLMERRDALEIDTPTAVDKLLTILGCDE